MDNPKLLFVSKPTFSLPIPPSYISARELTNSFSKYIASLLCTAKDELTLWGSSPSFIPCCKYILCSSRTSCTLLERSG